MRENGLELSIILGGICQTNTLIGVSYSRGTANPSAVIVDPVVSADYILRFLQNIKCDITKSKILITHGHFDHILTVSDLQNMGAKVYISETDYRLLQKQDFDFKLDGFSNTAVKPFRADVLLNDGDTFTVAGVKYKVMATPGHTPGSICYISESERFIISGDTLFRLSVGRTDFPYSDGNALNKSIKKLFSLSGDYTVYPGHGPITTLDFERQHNFYAY